LQHLPSDQFALLRSSFRIATLAQGAVIHEDGETPDIAYFPLTAIISNLALMRNGKEVEYGSVGREGMLGVQIAFNSQPQLGRAICQVEGEVASIDGAVLRSVAKPGSLPHALLTRYAQSATNVIAQSTACNALHSVKQRLARWLLMTHDRVESDHFYLTQVFLAKMLGVRRSGVSVAAKGFQDRGLIDYRRAHIYIRNRKRLLDITCECYDIVQDEYAKVFAYR
jgi:CRP-like cAMP-binding protein